MMDAELQRLKDISKREWARNLATLERMRAQQAADAKAAGLEAKRIANTPAPEQTEYPVTNLQILNGKIVNKPTPQPSIAIARTETFLEMNRQALQKK
jgi:hypothetical protein